MAAILPAQKALTGMTIAFPDVCKTPTPVTAGIPIPYPNCATIAKDEQTTVTTSAKTPMTNASKLSRSAGDEAGTLKGMVSLQQTNVKVQGELAALRGELTVLHNQLQSPPPGNPDHWQAALEKYVAAASALYVTMMSGKDQLTVPAAEIVRAREPTAVNQIPLGHREPGLDLIEPRAVGRGRVLRIRAVYSSRFPRDRSSRLGATAA